MKLNRLTPLQYFELRTPIWNNGQWVVGLNIDLIKKHNKVEITYIRKKDGRRSFPIPYYFDGDRLKTEKFPVQVVKGGIRLALIPLNSMPYLEPEDSTETQDLNIKPVAEQIKLI